MYFVVKGRILIYTCLPLAILADLSVNLSRSHSKC